MTTGSAVDPRLRADWARSGAAAFTLNVLEEIDQQPEQSHAEFLVDLRTLEQLWRTNLDASKAY